MSFKTWSAAQGIPVKKQADDKVEDAPAAAAQPAKPSEKLAVQGPPLRKS